MTIEKNYICDSCGSKSTHETRYTIKYNFGYVTDVLSMSTTMVRHYCSNECFLKWADKVKKSISYPA